MKNKNLRRSLVRGFTLLEMMLVVVIMGVLMSIAAWNLLGQGTKAKRAASIASMKTVDGMLKTYNLDYGSYPPDLQTLVTKKYASDVPKDGWKRPLIYTVGQAGSPHPFELYSTGESGNQGGDDNIDFWHADDAPQ
jgi:general secretion pathway protein G